MSARSYCARIGVINSLNSRSLYIVTSSMPNAMAIAKANCKGIEEVLSVMMESDDVIVDYQAIKPDDACN